MPTENPPRFVPPLSFTARACGSVEPRQPVSHTAELTLHLLVVRRIGEVRQVALPVRQSACDLALIAQREPAVPPLAARLGIQHEKAVDDGHHLVPLLPPPVADLEVGRS